VWKVLPKSRGSSQSLTCSLIIAEPSGNRPPLTSRACLPLVQTTLPVCSRAHSGLRWWVVPDRLMTRPTLVRLSNSQAAAVTNLPVTGVQSLTVVRPAVSSSQPAAVRNLPPIVVARGVLALPVSRGRLVAVNRPHVIGHCVRLVRARPARSLMFVN